MPTERGTSAYYRVSEMRASDVVSDDGDDEDGNENVSLDEFDHRLDTVKTKITMSPGRRMQMHRIVKNIQSTFSRRQGSQESLQIAAPL